MTNQKPHRNQRSLPIRLVQLSTENIHRINSLYTNEPYPIFEHNWLHVLTYKRFRVQLYWVECNDFTTVLIDNDSELILFTPRIYGNISKFIDYVKHLQAHRNKHLARIENVSKPWINNYGNTLVNKLQGLILTRSPEEAVYSTSLLTTLHGKAFKHLRYVKRKLSSDHKLLITDVTNKNIEQALSVYETWMEVQGSKYSKNKYTKERYILTELVANRQIFDNIYMKLATYDGKPVGVSIYFASPTHRGWGQVYTIKGINRASDGGVHGLSDYLYLRAFTDLLNEQSVTYINDGELGVEQGTREHKLRFRPINYLQSYDIKLK